MFNPPCYHVELVIGQLYAFLLDEFFLFRIVRCLVDLFFEIACEIHIGFSPFVVVNQISVMIIPQDLSQNNHTKGKRKIYSERDLLRWGCIRILQFLSRKICGIGENRCSFYARKEGYFDIW